MAVLRHEMRRGHPLLILPTAWFARLCLLALLVDEFYKESAATEVAVTTSCRRVIALSNKSGHLQL